MIDSKLAFSIKMLSLKGKALASILGTHTDLEGCAPDELALSLYMLEGIFAEILESVGGDTLGLEPVNSQGSPTAVASVPA